MLSLDLSLAVNLRLDNLVLIPNTAVALLSSTAPTAVCPRCGTSSDRIHSRYRRTVADLPCQNRAVVLRLIVRKFRCPQPDCPQSIFCERLPDLLIPHARCTGRLADAHRSLGFALGGEAGARLAERLTMPTSPDTLLRRINEAVEEPSGPVRFVGLDDWAWRKGHYYGTIVVDLERGRVIDLLPDRDQATVEQWLREHPEVEVISRDRWSAIRAGCGQRSPRRDAGGGPLAFTQEPPRSRGAAIRAARARHRGRVAGDAVHADQRPCSHGRSVGGHTPGVPEAFAPCWGVADSSSQEG